MSHAAGDERLFNADLLRLRADITFTRLLVKLLLFQHRLRQAQFNPAQPRVPGGSPGGGHWTSDPGGASVVVPAALADPKQYSVVLADEDAAGGHTIREHVNVADAELLASVRSQMGHFLIWDYGTARGRFLSLEAANDFVNRTLQLNADKVDAVAKGSKEKATIDQWFGSETGTEAYSDGSFDPIMRPTHSVRVIVRHDQRSARGYRVFTAFPVNKRPADK